MATNERLRTFQRRKASSRSGPLREPCVACQHFASNRVIGDSAFGLQTVRCVLPEREPRTRSWFFTSASCSKPVPGGAGGFHGVRVAHRRSSKSTRWAKLVASPCTVQQRCPAAAEAPLEGGSGSGAGHFEEHGGPASSASSRWAACERSPSRGDVAPVRSTPRLQRALALSLAGVTWECSRLRGPLEVFDRRR